MLAIEVKGKNKKNKLLLLQKLMTHDYSHIFFLKMTFPFIS